MIYLCSNNRRLVVTSKSNLSSTITDKMVPCIVLLTAWSREHSCLEFWEGPIHFFLERGCTYFVCAGVYAEVLHDAIDDFLCQDDDELVVEKNMEVVTTYHADESIRDIVHFFVHSTEMRDQLNGYLVAVLEENDDLNREIMCYLITS